MGSRAAVVLLLLAALLSVAAVHAGEGRTGAAAFVKAPTW